MEPQYDGRVTVAVSKQTLGTWALPKHEYLSAGRASHAGLHIGHSWVPSRLCRFMPWEMGWLVQLGRARASVHTKLGTVVHPPRSVVALQPGRSRIVFPELDDFCLLGVVIGADEALGRPEAHDSDGRGEVARTSYAAAEVTFTTNQRQVLACVFEHLLPDRPGRAPENLITAGAARSGKSQATVKKIVHETRLQVNRSRWFKLDTTEQLGHYLVRLSRTITLADLPPGPDQG